MSRQEALARLARAVESGAEACIRKHESGTYQVTVRDERHAAFAEGDDLCQATRDSVGDYERQRRMAETRKDIRPLR